MNIKELRDNIIDPNFSLSVVLRKAKVLASLLQNEEFKKWVNSELNGYRDDSEVPQYRRIRAQSFGTLSLPFGRIVKNAVIPTFNLPEEVKNWAENIVFFQGVKELEALTLAGNNPTRRWPAEAIMLVQDNFGHDRVLIDAYQPISKSQIESILDTIRNKLLDFVLELQERNPQITESEEAISKIPKEQVGNVFNVTISGNYNVLATGTDISQSVYQNISSGNLEELINYFKQFHVSEEDLQELKEAIKQDGKRPKKQLGVRAKDWIGKMTGKAVEGIWKVGVANVSNLIIKALSKYYGWDMTP